MLILWAIIYVLIAIILYYALRKFRPQNDFERRVRLAMLGFGAITALVTSLSVHQYYKHGSDPSAIVEDMSQEEQLTLINDSRAHPESLEALAKIGDRNVRYALAARKEMPTHIREMLLEDSDPAIRKRTARNPHTPIKLLMSRAQSEGDKEVEVIIKNAIRAREEMGSRQAGQEVAVADPYQRVLEALETLEPSSEDYKKIKRAAENAPSLYSMDALGTDANPEVRYAAASSDKMSNAMLQELLSDEDHGVREIAAFTLARKPVTSGEMLEALSLHDNPYVRQGVATNSSTPVHVLEALARDPIRGVVAQVASNERTPAHILRTLASDSDREIRRRIARHPFAPDTALTKLSSDPDEETRRRVASNPNTHPILLSQQLAYDSLEDIRYAVAANGSTADVALKHLAQDSSAKVREAVAGNPNTSVEVVKQLANDSAEKVRKQANYNLRNFRETLRSLSKESNEFTRRKVAQNPNTPAETLTTLAEDDDVYVRERVALNPSTPKETLLKLKHDDEPRVRWAAQENPNSPLMEQ